MRAGGAGNLLPVLRSNKRSLLQRDECFADQSFEWFSTAGAGPYWAFGPPATGLPVPPMALLSIALPGLVRSLVFGLGCG